MGVVVRARTGRNTGLGPLGSRLPAEFIEHIRNWPLITSKRLTAAL
jgi:hypothetical protein